MSTLHEECGVFGIYARDKTDVSTACYYALFALQHRGQESCGIAVNDRGVVHCHKGPGLVGDVFTEPVLRRLGAGQIAIGHVRYGTTGSGQSRNAQPILVNHTKGCMAVAHNGSLTNAAELRQSLEMSGAIFHTTSDTEVIAYVVTQQRLKAPSIEQAIENAMDTLKGAYSLTVLSPTKLIAVRDPNGFRPLCIGMQGNNVVFASETCALDAVGATYLRDVEPGEIVVADANGLRSLKRHCGTTPKTTCIFEYIYFARPDSRIDGSCVSVARQRAGSYLALEHPVAADVVIGVPDSGIDAAIGYARQSGIPYALGFIKNKYIARTFIQPEQADRENRVRIKLNPVASAVRGKRVVLVDDSIVRGTTCARIVRLLREAGALEVHMRSSAPPFLHPCYFGTDIDSREHLIACQHTMDEIRDMLGVDTLGYLSCENVTKLPDCTTGFCTACFTGQYPCEPPAFPDKSKFERHIVEDE